jgi:glutamine synthetase
MASMTPATPSGPDRPDSSARRNYVLRTVEERGVRLVRLWFTDVLGQLKSFAISPAELESAFEEGLQFDGSAIDGFSRIQESDVLARPDAATFELLPWDGRIRASARMFCDLTTLDGTPSPATREQVLRRVTWPLARGPGYSFFVPPRSSSSTSLSGDPSQSPGTARHRVLLRPDHADVASDLRRRTIHHSRPWASRSSTRSTRTAPASTRSTCATPTRCPWPTT